MLSRRSIIDLTLPGLLSLILPNTDMNIVRKIETRTVRIVERTSILILYFYRTCHECRSVIISRVLRLGGGLSRYNNNEVKMTIAPRITKKFSYIPKRIGKIYIRILVIIVVARYLIIVLVSRLLVLSSTRLL